MKTLDAYIDGYKLKLEKLIISCDGMELEGIWDLDEMGEMDAYLVNELMSVVLPLVAADGKVAEEEVKYINRIFGTDYSMADLNALCVDFMDLTYDEIEERIKETSGLLKRIDEEFEENYRDMYVTLCELVEVSDFHLSIVEEAFLKSLKETMKNL